MGVSPSLSASNALARSRSLAGILVATLLSSSTGASLLRLGPPPPAVGCHRRLRNAPAARLQGRAAPRGGGSGDAGGRGEQVGGDVAEGWGAAEGEAPLQLLAVAVQDGLDSAGATGGEAPDDGAPEQDGSGAQRQGLDDVDATADATVDVDLGAAGHGLDDLWERVRSRDGAVELAASVVGDDDRGGAGVQAGDRVVAAQHALDDHGKARLHAQPGDRLRGHGGVEVPGDAEHVDPLLGHGEVRESHAGRELELVAPVALAIAGDGHVGGQHHRLVAAGGGPPDQIGGDPAATAAIPSSDAVAWVETTIRVPAAAAPVAVASSPSGCARRW